MFVSVACMANDDYHSPAFELKAKELAWISYLNNLGKLGPTPSSSDWRERKQQGRVGQEAQVVDRDGGELGDRHAGLLRLQVLRGRPLEFREPPGLCRVLPASGAQPPARREAGPRPADQSSPPLTDRSTVPNPTGDRFCAM